MTGIAFRLKRAPNHMCWADTSERQATAKQRASIFFLKTSTVMGLMT